MILFRSDLKPTEPEYTVLARFPLGRMRTEENPPPCPPL